MTAETLTDLLRQAINANGDATLRRLQEMVEAEERVRPRGLTLNRTTASQILRGTYRGIASDGTIRAVAWLAGVSDERAYAAAGREVPGPPFIDELPTGIDALAPRERVAVLDVAKAFVANRDEIRRLNVRYGERLVHILVQLGTIQRVAESTATDEDIEPDMEQFSEALNVIAYDLYLVALEAFSGDERRLRHERLQIAMDARASGFKLLPIMRSGRDHADDATASHILNGDMVETIGISWDWSTITTSLRPLHSELYEVTEFSELAPQPSDSFLAGAVPPRARPGRESQRPQPAREATSSRSVVKNPRGGWDVKKPGSERPSAHASTQAEAIDRAREILRESGGGEMRVHSRGIERETKTNKKTDDSPDVP